jgi:isopentenyldiphosphate isomerase
MEELFDIVDDQGRVIGQAPRSRCHGDPSLIHRAVHVLVFDPDGRLYLQKRAENKDIQPGRWDTSVGGHLAVGETYEQAAVREMREELAIEGARLERLYDYPWRNAVESEDVRTFRVVWRGPVRFDPIEISEGRFWTVGEIRTALGTDLFTPNFEHEFARYLALVSGAP